MKANKTSFDSWNLIWNITSHLKFPFSWKIYYLIKIAVKRKKNYYMLNQKWKSVRVKDAGIDLFIFIDKISLYLFLIVWRNNLSIFKKIYYLPLASVNYHELFWVTYDISLIYLKICVIQSQSTYRLFLTRKVQNHSKIRKHYLKNIMLLMQ